MGIDLNAVEEDEPAGAAVCGELWHACAGAGVALPRWGSAVVYLPQAHLAEGGRGDGVEVPAGAAARVPPHVACRVVDVELRADAATVEVYARLALVAEGKVKYTKVVEALDDSDWVIAMQKELINFTRNEVWELVELSKQNVIGPK
ncbi:auxin response factor 14-like [Panicum virgatum]|uniref:auxin response factor 14-like n=1 Tax=Panicum virgatum TaxID=38727 RepID=UPI0019D69879|nr:auxin response factor 14-like [Panicum virgatum]